MDKPLTLFDKIWQVHHVANLPDCGKLIAIDRIFLHERTGAAALNSMVNSGRMISDSDRVFAVMDHIVDTRIGRNDQTLMPGGHLCRVQPGHSAADYNYICWCNSSDAA